MPLPLTTLPASVSTPVLSPQALPAAQINALYLHVPFCFHKCHYCDFYSITRQTPERMQRFVDRLLIEADQWLAGLVTQPVIRTVFIGGGTPSLLPVNQMQRLLDGVKARFDLSRLEEWTVEANPATVTDEYCRMLRACGVDRISFGAQSFNTDELKTLERHHNPDEVLSSVELARSAGFQRLNLDLIFAIPKQTMESWISSLEAALVIKTTHLSCYALTYEPNTPIAVRRRMGQLEVVAEDLEMQMLHATRDRMTAAGVLAYEISNFATPGQECRHNLNYWTGGNYIGLGPSAASHVEGWRWKNRPHLGEWETAIDGGALPVAEAETLSPRQRLGELAMLMLRLERGLDLPAISNRLHLDARTEFGQAIDRLQRLGLITDSHDLIRLTRKGLNVADAIAGEFV